MSPMPSPMTTLAAAFQRTAAIDPSAVALRTVGDSQVVTWREYADRVRSIAEGLWSLGVRRGDTVALMLTNRPEFNLVDTAAIHLGATPFSVYNTSSPEQIEYLLGSAGSEVVITEDVFVDRIRESGVPIDHVVTVDGTPGTLALADLEAMTAGDFDFDATWRAVRPDDVLTLIYTSGTTGPPKGVQLTHANLLAELDAIVQVVEVRRGDRITSYLPAAHVAERLSTHYLQLGHGVQITCVPDAREIASALPGARPTIWVAVPRVWEKIKRGLEVAIEHEPSAVKRHLLGWAMRVSRQRIRAQQDGERIRPHVALQARLADVLVFSKVRSRLGFDELRWAMSGAAAIAPEVVEFFLALGIPVCEVWGMSESCGAATCNPPGAIRLGSVGKLLPGVELRIADDGEALLRGPIVMAGYRNDPERTADAVDAEGWLHTGDIAAIDADGYVTIVDRKKELIINAGGKNMSPSNIENTIKAACPLMGSMMAFGDGRPYNVALVVLDPDAAAAFAAAHGTAARSADVLARDPAVLAAITEAVESGNQRLSRVEQIKRFVVLPDLWEPGGDELTATMKLRRKSITTKYRSEIDRLYVEPRG